MNIEDRKKRAQEIIATSKKFLLVSLIEGGGVEAVSTMDAIEELGVCSLITSETLKDSRHVEPPDDSSEELF